jgi:hypothetical protein
MSPTSESDSSIALARPAALPDNPDGSAFTILLIVEASDKNAEGRGETVGRTKQSMAEGRIAA